MEHTRKRILSMFTAAALAFCLLPQNMPLLRPAMTACAGETANPASEFEYTNIGDGIQIKKWNGSGETVVVPSEINGLPVNEISGSAFKDQALLTKITLPDTIAGIGQNAFNGCLSLTEINIPDGVTSIEFSTFSNCGALKTLTIPESVKSIGRYAFANSGLTSVTLPKGLTALGEYAFQSCSDLKSIVIPGGETGNARPCCRHRDAFSAASADFRRGPGAALNIRRTKIPSAICRLLRGFIWINPLSPDLHVPCSA